MHAMRQQLQRRERPQLQYRAKTHNRTVFSGPIFALDYRIRTFAHAPAKFAKARKRFHSISEDFQFKKKEIKLNRFYFNQIELNNY